MKTYSRRYRRSRLTSREQAMFKRNNQQEHAFFNGPSNDSFFKPVMRKCDHCAAEEKTVHKMSEGKEDEKKVQKQEEKKEEKPVMKMDEKKEPDKSVSKQDEKKEEKPVQKMEEKKEEKPVMKMDEKKEEKPVMKMDEKKEPDKSVSKQDEKKEEKPVQKMEEKKEEKPVMKMDEKKEPDKSVSKQEEKKEEKPVMKMEEKKEPDKSVSKKDEKKEEKPEAKLEEKKEEKPVMKMEEKKEEKVSKKQAASNVSNTGPIGAYLKSLAGKGNSLPSETQQFFKQRMGQDFSNVKIHTGTEAEQSAKDLNAKAYAIENNIVFNKGQYNPGTPEGRKLLAHELTHVVQQKGNGTDVLSRATEHAEIRKKESADSVTSTGKATNSKNQIDFACQGVSVEGRTEANYTDSFTSSGSIKPSNKCPECPEDCVKASGTVVSVFKANPTVFLPSVPDGLSECESKAVAKFINTTLRSHEQKHVAAFNTYNATVKTPYKYTGCQSGLDSYLQSLHDAINAKRTDAANKKSAKLDPFNPKIPCKCEE